MDILALKTSRVPPPMELLDDVWGYLFLHPFRCRDKCVLWYLSVCLVTSSVIIFREQLTNGASMSSFIVSRAASWHIDTTSAPEHPSVCGRMRRARRLRHRNIPKGQFLKCRSRGRHSSWINGCVEFLLCPGDLGVQHIPDDPVALVA